MKHYTTIEQSKKLVELGLNPDTADMLWEQHICESPYVTVKPYTTKGRSIGSHILPCWSLGALLDIINNNNLVYDISNDKHRDFEILVYRAYYIEQKLKFYHNEHTIVDMIVWLLENNYIKIKKL